MLEKLSAPQGARGAISSRVPNGDTPMGMVQRLCTRDLEIARITDVKCVRCGKRKATVGPRGGANHCNPCREYMKRYRKSWREGGRLVRCPCGKEFIDHLGREFCSRACAEPIELFRVCRDCGEIKPLTEEFFRLARAQGTERAWFRRVCIDCLGVYTQRHADRAQAEDPEGRSYGQQKYAKRPEVYKGKVRRRKALQQTTQGERV